VSGVGYGAEVIVSFTVTGLGGQDKEAVSEDLVRRIEGLVAEVRQQIAGSQSINVDFPGVGDFFPGMAVTMKSWSAVNNFLPPAQLPTVDSAFRFLFNELDRGNMVIPTVIGYTLRPLPAPFRTRCRTMMSMEPELIGEFGDNFKSVNDWYHHGEVFEKAIAVLDKFVNTVPPGINDRQTWTDSVRPLIIEVHDELGGDIVEKAVVVVLSELRRLQRAAWDKFSDVLIGWREQEEPDDGEWFPIETFWNISLEGRDYPKGLATARDVCQMEEILKTTVRLSLESGAFH
jgi:hypothetical protein